MQATSSALALARGISRSKIFLFAFFSVITIAPLMMIHSQWITGPLVNATLILTCALVGPTEAVILGLFPSPAALTSGLLPLALAAMIPFIMIGNALYVATFHYFRKRQTTGIIVGSVLKFAFLSASVNVVMSRLLPSPIIKNLSMMMSWPQLATALIGGAVALALLSFLPRSVRSHQEP